MTDWRAQVLKEFTPEVARLSIAADPDGLLLEEGVLQELGRRGFELIAFEDHIEFRYAFESKYRSQWDSGGHIELIVVVRSPASELNRLPYDLLYAGRKASVNLAELFPNLSYSIVATLDRSDLDALYVAQHQQNPGKLGDNATKDFVLRHVFEIAPELIKQPTDLLRVLLRRHHAERRVPQTLDARFIEILRRGEQFRDWPLKEIIPNREWFLTFLQERWPRYLDTLTDQPDQTSQPMSLPGTEDLPFGHDDVRVYVDTLFLEALLQPVDHPCANVLANQWVAVGLRTDPHADRQRRLSGLLIAVQDSLPAEDAGHHEWLVFAYRWAEVVVLWIKHSANLQPSELDELVKLRQRIDSVFHDWVAHRYAGLHNQPAVPPVMIHHVARDLCRRREASDNGKVALVVLDGLAIQQWIILRDVLHSRRRDFQFRESAVFAWLPTITPVSRQAAFAGKLPLYFPSSIHSTDRDGAHWTQFWAGHGLTKQQVGYLRGLGNGDLDRVRELVSNPMLRAIGLVVDKVDKIMHGMQLGMLGMHNQVRQWAEQGYLADLCALLLDHGFAVALTSDHGNIEATGIGRPAEGVIADKRGERVRVYPDEELRASVHERYPQALSWPAIGLPDDYLPLMAPERSAFVPEGETIVGHGGISIEELLVPMIHVERMTQ